MYREMLKSKIHRARVTQADLHYVGSLTIDRTLMEKADLVAGEKVDVVDIDNGTRLSTYVIEGPADTGVIGVNGAAARLISPGDLVIIIAYAGVTQDEVGKHQASVVFVDENNRPVQLTANLAKVPDGFGLSQGDAVIAGGQRP